MALNLDTLLISLFFNVLVPTVVLSPVLWLAGRAVVGRRKAEFANALWIVFLGTIIGSVFSIFFVGTIASIVQFVPWLALVKHFFDCEWLAAFAISVLAAIIFAVLAIILGLLGFGIWTIGSEATSTLI